MPSTLDMTNTELIERYERIIRKFEMSALPDDLAWNWARVGILFPKLLAESQEIRAEANRRKQAGLWIEEEDHADAEE